MVFYLAKGERRKKREEIRRIVSEDEKRRKDKVKKKDKPRSTNYRRDKEGNIILFGNLRFSKTALGVLLGIAGIGIFFYVMSFGVGEMDGYIEPEFTFASCEEGGFTADMCKFHYKFCREYADGGKLCTFAETDPYVDLPDLGDKFTDEEQDFLPPTDYESDLSDDDWRIEVDNMPRYWLYPFIQFAEARGGDEPSCYTDACKKAHPNLDDGDESEEVKDVVTAKADLEAIKDNMGELITQINEWDLDSLDWYTDLRDKLNEMEDAEEEYDLAKKAKRWAMDVKPQNAEDIAMQKDAIEEFNLATKKLKQAQKEYALEKNLYDTRHADLLTAKNELIYARDSLDMALKEVTTAKVNANQKNEGDNKFINIVLSKSCLQLINNNMTTDCPTYTELRQQWDNTIPHVSGEWVETEFDIKRESPKYKNYWNYYQALPNWKIITVDPDAKIMDRGITITIMASDFIYHENIDSSNKSPSYNNTGAVKFQWENVKYHDNCRKVMMAPDMDLLAGIINNLWDNCDSQEPTVIELLFEKMDSTTSQFYAYSSWLTDAMEKCKEKC